MTSISVNSIVTVKPVGCKGRNLPLKRDEIEPQADLTLFCSRPLNTAVASRIGNLRSVLRRAAQHYFGVSCSQISVTFFGQPFVKRFAVCYQTVVCL